MTYAKLVIKVPEELLEYFANHNCMSEDGWFSHSSKLLDAFRNGTPLLEVLDEIRAEIESIIGENKLDDYDFCSGLICARNIIDKYKAEGGDK